MQARIQVFDVNSADLSSYVPGYPNTLSDQKGAIDLTVKFTVSHNVGPPTLARAVLTRLLFKSGCRQFSRRRVAPIPRAEYEEQACEYWYQAVVTPMPDERQDQMMVRLIQKLCYFLGGGFHDQILAELPGIKMIFAEVR
ncbi:hypothetical protein OSTOST_00894 [Ostertagia ostertagi]